MSGKVLVIISTGNAEKAKTGVMWTMRSMQEGWIEEIKLIFFGAGSEKLLLENEEIKDMLKQIMTVEKPIACKAIADKEGISEDIEKIGLKVVYVGKVIADYIKDGYVPMVW